MIEFTEGQSVTRADLERLKQAQREEYEAELSRERRPISFERAEHLLYLYNDSYERLGEVVRYSQLMNRRSWLKLLGESWDGVDDIARWQWELHDLLPKRTCFLMMDEEERTRWQSLPKVVTIYRGCSEINEDGLSWSLNREIAAKFPGYFRYRPPKDEEPQLVTAKVPRSRIVAVKLGRQEEEVITCRARPVKWEPIDPIE